MIKMQLSILMVLQMACGTSQEHASDYAEHTASGSNAVADTVALPEAITVQNGNNLTKGSLQSYLPQQILEAKSDGRGIGVDSDEGSDGPAYSMMAREYSADHYRINAAVYDYADDPQGMRRRKSRVTAVEGATVREEGGVTVIESVRDNNQTLRLINDRFEIELTAMPAGGHAPSHKELYAAYESSYMPRLFEEQVHDQEDATNEKIALDCDQLLPLAAVENLCNAGSLELRVTDFEKETNCNRVYRYPGGLGGLILIVTQYLSNEQAYQAVEIKLHDDDLDSQELNVVGDRGVLVTVGDDLFASFASNNYLIEIRSTTNTLGGEENCCVCQDEAALKTIGQQVIGRLP